MTTTAYSVQYKGRRYEIQPAFKLIKLIIFNAKGRLGYEPPIERTIDWDGPTGWAVRKALAKQEIK